MMPLLLAGWAAAADETYARLFGDADPAVAAVVEVGPTVPMWIWPAALLGLGVVAASRLRSSLPKSPHADLTILQRQPAGDRSTLLVVEDRIRYEVNLKRARKVGLTFHSQILAYAARVCDGSAP